MFVFFFFTLYLCKTLLLTFGKHSQYPLEPSSTDVTETQPHRQPLFKETISTLETLNVFLFLFCSLTYSMSLGIFILCPPPCIFLSTVSDFVCSCSDWNLGTVKMRSTVGGPPGTLGHEQARSSNNNTSGEINGNSGSQYALCALGVGLIALGIVMIVWSVVPATPLGNSSSGGDPAGEGRKNKASSVAFVLTGCGVAMLLLSLCLGMRNKRREQQLREAQNHSGAPGRDQEQRETWVSWLTKSLFDFF